MLEERGRRCGDREVRLVHTSVGVAHVVVVGTCGEAREACVVSPVVQL